jgi:peptidoglycan/LPS O-acetylase OafA/YrhL
MLVILYKPSLVNAAESASYLRSIFLLPSLTNPLLNVSWTLVYEMYFYIIIAISIYTFQQRHWYRAVNTIIILSILAGLLLGNTRYDFAELKLITSPLLLEFLLGMFIYYLLDNHLHILKYKWLYFIVGSSLLLMYHYHLSPLENIQVLGSDIYDNRIFYFGLPAFLIVLSMLSFEYENKLFKNRILKKIGDASFSLYLSHYFILVLISKLWETAHLPVSYIANLLFISISIFIALLIGFLSYKYVERPITLYLNKKFDNVTI